VAIITDRVNTDKVTDIAKAKREEHCIQDLTLFNGVRHVMRPAQRLENVRRRALQFREMVLSGGEANFLKTEDLVYAPYPTKFAYLHAVKSWVPYILLSNKMFIVQFNVGGSINSARTTKNLLFGINDPIGNGETPYFKSMRERGGWIAKNFVEPRLEKAAKQINQQLAINGLSPKDIDYISFDHLHVQDLRKWLGSDGSTGFFPNAKLLVMRQEWESTQGLLPIQQPWYCPDGAKGIDANKIILLDSSAMLGHGVALLQTPGHTEGNQSLVVHIDGQLFVASENGMSADSYAPLFSRIPGLQNYALKNNVEVILNGNTLENSIDQYISMVMEKTIAGPHLDYDGFCNFIPSSEHAPMWFSRSVNPTVQVSNLNYGMLMK